MQPLNPIRRKITKRKDYPDAYEINITPVMNLFICLIPFLLMSAVFIQLSIIETNAPATEGKAGDTKETSLLMVVVNKSGFVITGVGEVVKGQKKALKIAKKSGSYNYEKLTKALEALKKNDPEAEELLLMSAPDIAYSVLVEVMDAARAGADGSTLFPNAFFGGVTS